MPARSEFSKNIPTLLEILINLISRIEIIQIIQFNGLLRFCGFFQLNPQFEDELCSLPAVGFNSQCKHSDFH